MYLDGWSIGRAVCISGRPGQIACDSSRVPLILNSLNWLGVLGGSVNMSAPAEFLPEAASVWRDLVMLAALWVWLAVRPDDVHFAVGRTVVRLPSPACPR